VWCEVLVGGSGSNEKSNGHAEVSEVINTTESESIYFFDMVWEIFDIA